MINEIVDKRLDKKATELGSYLFDRLSTLKKYGVVREVRGKGILLGVELVKDEKTVSRIGKRPEKNCDKKRINNEN